MNISGHPALQQGTFLVVQGTFPSSELLIEVETEKKLLQKKQFLSFFLFHFFFFK